MSFGGFEESCDDLACNNDEDDEKADSRNKDCCDACDEKPYVVDDSRDDCGWFVLRRFRIFMKDSDIKNLKTDGSKQKVDKIN